MSPTPAPGQPYPLLAQTAGEALDQLAALNRDDDANAYALAMSAVDLGAPPSIVRSVLLGYIAAVHPDPDEPPAPPSVVDRGRQLLTDAWRARWR